MTRVTTMLGMAAGAVMSLTAPVLADQFRYLNPDCEPSGSGCPMVIEPTRIAELLRLNGISLADFKAGNPELPHDADGDYVIKPDGQYVLYWPYEPSAQRVNITEGSYLDRMAEQLQGTN